MSVRVLKKRPHSQEAGISRQKKLTNRKIDSAHLLNRESSLQQFEMDLGKSYVSYSALVAASIHNMDSRLRWNDTGHKMKEIKKKKQHISLCFERIKLHKQI